MKNLFEKLTIAQKLALVAFVLGFIALLIGNPNNSNKITINAKELSLSTIKDHDKINVMTLADWIIKEKGDYTLVDLRSEKEFNEYNIPTSINIPIESLLNSDLMRNQKIIVYGNDDVTSAQAWFILKSANYKAVYILNGGLNAWKNEILFPKLDVNATEEQKAEFEKVKQISLHFGGSPQIISGGTATVVNQEIKAPTTPKISAPVSTGKPAAKKKKEGC
ncbi:MAG: rhodanese-like domain-containing protein [Stygiobacter sp.]